MTNLGYACINMQLSYPREWGGQPRGTVRTTTNRSMIRKTFDAKGLDYASELALNNVLDLEKIIQQNRVHPDVHLEMGLLLSGPLAAASEPTEARKHLNAFLRMAPNHRRSFPGSRPPTGSRRLAD